MSMPEESKVAIFYQAIVRQATPPPASGKMESLQDSIDSLLAVHPPKRNLGPQTDLKVNTQSHARANSTGF